MTTIKSVMDARKRLRDQDEQSLNESKRIKITVAEISTEQEQPEISIQEQEEYYLQFRQFQQWNTYVLNAEKAMAIVPELFKKYKQLQQENQHLKKQIEQAKFNNK